MANLVKKIVPAVLSVGLVLSPITASAQMEALGGMLGAVAGGHRGGTGGAVAGAIIGVAIGTILQQLSEQERASRQQSLQRAARSGSASWNTKGKSGKKATYKRVGKPQTASNGQKCQKVRETITLADGKRGTAEETVCFS